MATEDALRALAGYDAGRRRRSGLPGRAHGAQTSPHVAPPLPATVERGTRRRRRAGSSVVAPIAMLLMCACTAPAAAQYVANSVLYNESLAFADAELTAELENAPGLDVLYYPSKYELPINYYADNTAATEYTQNVIFDPCRYYGYACCNDTYGTPEFMSAPAADGTQTPLAADGSALDPTTSRRPANELYIDEDCDGPFPRPGARFMVSAVGGEYVLRRGGTGAE
jgi:hypothetical protein